MTSARSIAYGLLATLAATGCGGDRFLPLSGEVQVNEQPVPTGSIEFTSVADDSGASAEIIGGSFAVSADQGVLAGSYKVRIYGYQPTGKQIPDSDLPGKSIPEMKSIVPPQYNDFSELIVEIAEENSTSLDFHLDDAAK